MSLRRIVPPAIVGGGGGYGVVSIHRNENLSNSADFDLLMSAVATAAATLPLKFVLHPATRAKLARSGWDRRFDAIPGLELMDRVNYPDFVKLLVGSYLLMTDGGSNQEEAAMLGLPTLLLRRATERPDGLGDTIELSNLQTERIHHFVAKYAGQTWEVRSLNPNSPSKLILQTLAERFA
ncbi:UDP-N-acetylglucosamine 2-epimerase [compost metagenome]